MLGILANASCFKAAIQANAKDVRTKVRNKWGHCNFDHWTDVQFALCFQVMEVMLRCLGLPKADEDKQVEYLRDWETKGWLLVPQRVSPDCNEDSLLCLAEALKLRINSLAVDCR